MLVVYNMAQMLFNAFVCSQLLREAWMPLRGRKQLTHVEYDAEARLSQTLGQRLLVHQGPGLPLQVKGAQSFKRTGLGC